MIAASKACINRRTWFTDRGAKKNAKTVNQQHISGGSAHDSPI
jgi:hypothetical protein